MTAAQGMSRSTAVDRLRAAGCVFAEQEVDLLLAAVATPQSLAELVERRAAGFPIEHVVGWADFCGLRIAVGPGIFVPRRRTELLVRRAVELAPAGAVVVDLCCGSGAIGAAIAALSGRIQLYAADVDPAAVRYARRNTASAGGLVFEGDLYDPLPETLRGTVSLIVACTPYVPTHAIHLLPAEARDHEPRIALDGGSDGLDVVRRVVAEAPRWLAPGGHVVVEVSEKQAPAVVQAATEVRLSARIEHSDDSDATVVVASG